MVPAASSMVPSAPSMLYANMRFSPDSSAVTVTVYAVSRPYPLLYTISCCGAVKFMFPPSMLVCVPVCTMLGVRELRSVPLGRLSDMVLLSSSILA